MRSALHGLVPLWLGALLAACTLLSMANAALAHEGAHQQLARANARIAAEPGEAGLYLQRAVLYRLHRDFAAAATDLQRAALIDPDLATLDLERAQLAAAQQQWLDALGLLERYLEQQPQDATAWLLHGKTCFRLQRFEASASAYLRALESLERAEPEVYHRRARALEACSTRGLERALACAEGGLQDLGRCISLELLAVDYESRLGRVSAALQRLTRLSAGARRQESWRVRRGDVLWDNQRRGEAQLEYRAALEAIERLRPRTRATAAVVALQEHATQRLK